MRARARRRSASPSTASVATTGGVASHAPPGDAVETTSTLGGGALDEGALDEGALDARVDSGAGAASPAAGGVRLEHAATARSASKRALFITRLSSADRT
jgi:hypothetical protein